MNKQLIRTFLTSLILIASLVAVAGCNLPGLSSLSGKPDYEKLASTKQKKWDGKPQKLSHKLVQDLIGSDASPSSQTSNNGQNNHQNPSSTTSQNTHNSTNNSNNNNGNNNHSNSAKPDNSATVPQNSSDYHYWPNGDRYLGQIVANHAEGHGKWDRWTQVYNDYYLIYDGNWKNGNLDGQGTMYLGSDGRQFAGTFKQNKVSGQGTYTFPGETHTGTWHEEDRNGKHYAVCSDGSSFDYEYPGGK